jgi:hypothetical protein
MSKHSRGPWRRHAAFENCIADADGSLIAGVTTEGDLHLIAAAPDLLAALEDLLLTVNPRLFAREVVQARAAIAKATGDAS